MRVKSQTIMSVCTFCHAVVIFHLQTNVRAVFSKLFDQIEHHPLKTMAFFLPIFVRLSVARKLLVSHLFSDWFCDSCKKTEHVSSNPRYHCLECHNFDLCEKCYNAKVEPKTHRWSHKMRRTPAQRSLNSK
jgi:hypothetical protein